MTKQLGGEGHCAGARGGLCFEKTLALLVCVWGGCRELSALPWAPVCWRKDADLVSGLQPRARKPNPFLPMEKQQTFICTNEKDESILSKRWE